MTQTPPTFSADSGSPSPYVKGNTGLYSRQGDSSPTFPPDPCTGTGTLSSGEKVTISSLKLKGQGTATSTPVTADVCVLGTINVTVSWTSDPKIAPTKLTYQGGTWEADEAPVLPAPGGNLVSDTGSFGGQGASGTISPKGEYPPNPCAGTKPFTMHMTGGTLGLSSPPNS